MVSVQAAAGAASAQLIQQLGDVCDRNGLPDLATRLTALQAWIAEELTAFEGELAVLPRGARAVQKAAHHLLDLGGKHLRPMCVALAAKLGEGFDAHARQLAMAVELVHTATLLHDDVVDVGEMRRGKPAARAIYGNAASIFAGDWLLVEALRRIRSTGDLALLDRMLGIIEEMILAESLQLERRGRLEADRDTYFRVVEGKTAALFRWGMLAGARAGRLSDDDAAALEAFGLHLGVAFQAVDDCLDFGGFGGGADTGKSLFTDLREGKLTYPIILAIERDPALSPVLERLLALDPADELPLTAVRQVAAALERTGALADCRALAVERIGRAMDALAPIADGPGKTALITVAEATAYRER